MLNDIYQDYVSFFEDQMPDQSELNFSELVFKPQNLLQQLLKMFPILTKSVHKQRTYIHLKELSSEELLCAAISAI